MSVRGHPLATTTTGGSLSVAKIGRTDLKRSSQRKLFFFVARQNQASAFRGLMLGLPSRPNHEETGLMQIELTNNPKAGGPLMTHGAGAP
jgi:hypothetical protein